MLLIPICRAVHQAKATCIAEIRKEGHEPRIEILIHGLADKETALKVDAAVINLLVPDNLTNEVRGYHSIRWSR